MTYRKAGFSRRIIASAVVLLFSANMTAADHAFAQELTKGERLSCEKVSNIAYKANVLVQKESNVTATVNLKNELLKNNQPVSPAAKAISGYDQKGRYSGLSTGFIDDTLLNELKYNHSLGYFPKKPASDKKTYNDKDRSPLVLSPERGIVSDIPIGDNMEKIGEIDGRPIYRIIEDSDPEPAPKPEGRPLTDQEEQEIADAEKFIDDLAEALFDTDGDGILDDAGKYDYEPGGDLSIDIGGIPVSREMRDLLKRIFVKLVWYNKANSLDINGIHIDIATRSPDGSLSDGIEITISDGKQKIVFSYIPPPGVSPTTIKTVKVTFRNLQNARKKLSDKIDAADEKISDRPKTGPSFSDPAENDRPESMAGNGPVTAGSAAKKSALNGGKKKPFNRSTNIVHGQPGKVKKDDIYRAVDIARDGYKLLRTEWRNEKSALDKAIEHILSEDAGAIYTNSGDTINAIILLKATETTGDDDENKDSDSGESS